ncbi:hypothetical protein E2C01_071223 [Portunus trituberculatus]|uniref:Uncharacterized protein n=1 Tax=Portunus trituberculatus TaxID=210409 RepID=A0A5B7HUT7_PORTR|nr:hypothetical protein [Portunus trituberculatus]
MNESWDRDGRGEMGKWRQ